MYWLQIFSWEPGEEKSKHIATIELTHAIRLLDKFEVFALDVGVRQVGPGYVQLFLNSVFGPFIVLQTVVPVEPLVQKVIHRFYVRPYTAVFSKFLVWGESVMVIIAFIFILFHFYSFKIKFNYNYNFSLNEI